MTRLGLCSKWLEQILAFFTLWIPLRRQMRRQTIRDRKSTRLNSSHITISYAVFCLKKNNRYHTHDYYQVDPLLGGNAAFKELLAAAHRRGIRLVLDGGCNHASRSWYQFNRIRENGR